jgi:glycine/D-amino acid oxidase-like deaminating enzyme
MRLRTFESFGLISNGILHSYPSLHDKNETCEITVVGGGITGALISYALVKKGYNVILVDKRDIGSGSTAATTSMLQYETDTPLYRLSGLIGEEGAVTCYKAGITAINKLAEIVKENNFDCGFEIKKSLYISLNEKDAQWLYEEFEIRNKYALGVKWLDAERVKSDYGINSHGAILSEAAATVDAYKLCHDLIAFNVSKGMKVYDQTEVKKFEMKEDFVTVHTESGCEINCQKIIFCTGYESKELLKEKTADLFYTYASVSECDIRLPEKLKDALVWDTGSPYFYMRYLNGRLLIGGEDSSYNHSAKVKERDRENLLAALNTRLPGVNFIEDFSWAGVFGSTKDSLPYIGYSPEYKNALFVLGYGGNGIIFSVQGMEIITDLLEGKQNELAKWYRFRR